MAFRKKVFTSQRISVFFGPKEVRVQALVSSYGAKYVFDEYDLPPEGLSFLGQEVLVSYKTLNVHCRMVREETAIGAIYNLRFIDPSHYLLRQIERDIKETGLPSPWLRSLPRLSTDSKHLPVPVLAIVHWRGEAQFLNIKNFTVGGLLLEFVGMKMQDAVFGAKIEMDIVTNSGEKLGDLAGIISRVSFEPNDNTPELSKFYFGLRFLPMSVLNEAKWRALIREHVLGLRSLEGASL